MRAIQQYMHWPNNNHSHWRICLDWALRLQIQDYVILELVNTKFSATVILFKFCSSIFPFSLDSKLDRKIICSWYLFQVTGSGWCRQKQAWPSFCLASLLLPPKRLLFQWNSVLTWISYHLRELCTWKLANVRSLLKSWISRHKT